jgi:hypothetical protein
MKRYVVVTTEATDMGTDMICDVILVTDDGETGTRRRSGLRNSCPLRSCGKLRNKLSQFAHEHRARAG